ncbi:uncharacterized protein LOC143297647 [Babylonia areolata]|uniref:uncharacterized protein LOC143297647 n=1 Tax=Babylonia areolata TaxID=304850 RepID=UPI003FCFA83D
MDDDSCGKFIGSLTKYLQSLCHSYVEFDSGVELVGHIYLHVDSGKKIDYVLNESVCKNGANVVKFTSNSYHAQPVEKKDKKDTPKKDSKESGKKNDDDDVIIVGSEGSRRNRTPGSSPSRSHASPNQMQRGMGMNRMSPGGMFRSPRGLSPRFGGPVPRPSGYTYQPRQRLTYPQSPRNILAGYSPRMRQPYQPRGAQPMPVRAPSAANPGSTVDTDVAFMREEYVAQPGQAGSSSANQAGYQPPYQGQQALQPQQQQQAGQVPPAAGQQYVTPYTQANATPGQPTGMTVPMNTPTAAAVQTGTAAGQLVEGGSGEGAMPGAASTTDQSLFQQAQPAVSGGMPLPVTTHTIFDSGPVMTPMDIPNAQPSVGEGGNTPAAQGMADPLAAAMTTAGVTTDNSVPTSTAASSTGLDAHNQNLLIGKVWSESNPDPNAAPAASDQPGTSNVSFPTGPTTGESTPALPSLPSTDPLQPGTGFDIFNQQPVTQTPTIPQASQSLPSFSPTLNQTNPLSQSNPSSGVDGDGFSALVSELQAFNQQAGAPPPPPQTQPTPSSTTTTPSSTTASAAESAHDKPSYGVSRTGERVLIKRDPGVKRDPDLSANLASSVLHESTEAAASQGSDNFLAPKDVGGTQAGLDRKRSGSASSSQSLGTPSPSSGSLVGPESVVIETKPFLHHSSDYDSSCDSTSTSAGDRLASPHGQPHSQAAASSQSRPSASSAMSSSSSSSASSSASSSSHPMPAVNVKKERKEEEEVEQETIKHAQSEWQNKDTESDWVTDMSALNNSDDSMESDSDTAQDDDDPNYTPGRPIGGADKGTRKRAPRKQLGGQKSPRSPATKTGSEAPPQQARPAQKPVAPPPSDDNVVNILDSDEEDQCGPSPSFTLPPNVMIKKEKPDEVVVKKEPEDDYEDTQLPAIATPKRRDPQAAASPLGMKRKVWTDREKDAVQMYFRTYLEEGTLPGKVEIEAVIAAEPSLQGRTWHNIKDYLRNAQLASSKRPSPKPADKGNKSKKRKLDHPDAPEGGSDEHAGEMTDEDADPPLPELPPALDSDQHMEPGYDEAVYKPGTFVLVNVTKDSDRSSRMRPTHTPAEVIVPPEGQTEGVWVHVLVSAGNGLWRLPNVDQLVDLRVDPADIVKPLEKSHVNIVGSKVFYKFDDIHDY